MYAVGFGMTAACGVLYLALRGLVLLIDAMDLEACFRQRVDVHAQGDGLAGAGGSDECATHALVHRLGECGGDLFLRVEREPFAHLQFAVKGVLRKPRGLRLWLMGAAPGRVDRPVGRRADRYSRPRGRPAGAGRWRRRCRLRLPVVRRRPRRRLVAARCRSRAARSVGRRTTGRDRDSSGGAHTVPGSVAVPTATVMYQAPLGRPPQTPFVPAVRLIQIATSLYSLAQDRTTPRWLFISGMGGSFHRNTHLRRSLEIHIKSIQYQGLWGIPGSTLRSRIRCTADDRLFRSLIHIVPVIADMSAKATVSVPKITGAVWPVPDSEAHAIMRDTKIAMLVVHAAKYRSGERHVPSIRSSS